jgi:hypothetical protein
MNAAIFPPGNAELAIPGLHLIGHYDIDPDDLNRLLLGLYFSKLKFREIAPRVDLKFELAGKDISTFDIHGVCVPISLFKDTVSDLQVLMKQYGEPVHHKNVGTRSRFLAPVSAQAYSLLLWFFFGC